MKIALLIRRTYINAPGGDVIMMSYINNFLISKGHIVLINPLNFEDFDLIHVFNIQDITETYILVKNLPENIPIIFSPVFWDSRFVNQNRLYVLFKEFLKSTSLSYFFKKYKLSRLVIDKANFFIFNSVAELEGFIYSYNCNVRKAAAVIPNVIDTDKFVNYVPFDKRDIDLICVGRIEEAKGQVLLLEALQGLNIKILFVGRLTNNNYSKIFLNLINNSSNVVTHITNIDNNKLPLYYNRSKFHVLLSKRESPGLVSMEALLCGCGAIISDNGPINEYFKYNCFFTTLDVNYVRRVVINALSHNSLDDYTDFYKDKFSLRHLSGYIDIYNELLLLDNHEIRRNHNQFN
jgi:glycosyltransferase involved in cell wall biosynthesis